MATRDSQALSSSPSRMAGVFDCAVGAAGVPALDDGRCHTLPSKVVVVSLGPLGGVEVEAEVSLIMLVDGAGALAGCLAASVCLVAVSSAAGFALVATLLLSCGFAGEGANAPTTAVGSVAALAGGRTGVVVCCN